MEIFFLFFLFLLSLILSTHRSLHKFIKKQSPTDDQNIPPGSTGWPLIGETLDYSSNLRKGALANFVTHRINNYSSKVFRTSLLGHPMAILPGPEGNKFLFCNERKLVKVWFPSSVDKLFPKCHNIPTHDSFIAVRKMLPPILKADALQRYVGIMDSLMKQQLQTLWNIQQGSKDEEIKKVYPRVSYYTLSLACRIFLSIDDPKRVEEILNPIEEVQVGMFSLPVNFPGTAFYRAIKASDTVRGKIEAMVKRRKMDLGEERASPTQDMVSVMVVTADKNGELFNDSDIASHLLGLLVGAYSTLSDLLCFILMYLAELPHVYHELLREQMEIRSSKEQKDFLDWEDLKKMRYSWNVAKEVLRLMPTARGTFRESVTDFTYEGYKIPKGWKMHWIAHATHKNPDYFPDPEKFDPSRFEGNGPDPYTFVPFGGGPRMCPGNEYARLAILVFMHNMVTNFKWEMILNEKDLTRSTLSPVRGFLIRLHHHSP